MKQFIRRVQLAEVMIRRRSANGVLAVPALGRPVLVTGFSGGVVQRMVGRAPNIGYRSRQTTVMAMVTFADLNRPIVPLTALSH